MLHPDLKQAVEDLEISGQVPTPAKSAHRSREVIDAARAWLRHRVPVDRAAALDVVVHGSFARQEATEASDFDYLVVAHGLAGDVRVMQDLLGAVDSFIQERLEEDGGHSDRRPGRTGLFGHIASAPGLTERIGLEHDTNVSMTRRLLILEESASIYQPDHRRKLLRVILERYLADYDAHAKRGVPRFLLNDVARYWYTIAVDYQAKRWEGHDRGWGLRYLKLLISRKLSYAGTITSLLLCDERHPATVDRLAEEFEKPPLARLAQLSAHPDFDQHDALRSALLIAERFAAFLSNSALRQEAMDVASSNDLVAHSLLNDVRKDAEQLHHALGKVLFDSFLGDRARRYLVL